MLFHSRRQKSRCSKCITPTLNRSHYSKFIANLEAPQHRNSCFQLKKKSTLPQNSPSVTPCQIREGIFSLPDPTSFPPKILTLGSHRTHHQTPSDDTQAHKGRQQQIPETPPGDKFRHTACIPADTNIHLEEPLLVQFLRQPKSALPNQSHTAQSSCATGHAAISGKSHVNQ